MHFNTSNLLSCFHREHARHLEDDRRKMERELHRCETRLQKCNSDLQRTTDYAQSIATSLTQAQERLFQVEAVHETQERETQRLRGELNSSVSLQTRCRAELEQKNIQIRQLHDKLMQGLVNGKWNPIPDDKIRQQIALLNTEIRDWAKEWVVRDLDPESFKDAEISSYFSQFSPFISTLLTRPTVQNSPRWRDKVPAILLNAVIAHEVHKAFFDNPFFCTDLKRQEAMWNLFCQVREVDQKEAHRWRSTLWRLLNPPETQEISDSARRMREHTQTHVEAYGEHFRCRFRSSPAKVLIREPASQAENDNQKNGFRKFLMTAASVATTLWTQRSFIETIDRDKMQGHQMKFDVSSPILKPHPFSKVDIEDESHNGREILMIIHPALLAFEEDDMKGFEGGEYRILAQAIVLLYD